MNKKPGESPRVFVSYSWTSPEHEEWVIQLARELVDNGVDVILDKWQLREGADKYAFMEKMVTDESVRKVVIVCDRLYAEKADGREGGVGTETQIISTELYEQVDRTGQKQKFVAVVKEKEQEQRPCLPTYLKGRIYIDMSDPDLRAGNFEQLLRWIYDQPLHKRPELGRPPAYIFEESAISRGTTSRFRQAMDALKQNKATAPGIISDYFQTFVENLESFRIIHDNGKQLDDQVIESIGTFLPYRDEVVDLIMAIIKYRPTSDMYGLVHTFLEGILLYGQWPTDRRPSWSEADAENFRIMLYEVFLYCVAAFLKSGRFDAVNELVARDYYFAGSPQSPQGNMAPFTFFNDSFDLLRHRGERLKLRRLSVVADIVKERAKRRDLPFSDIMQADFLLYLRPELQSSAQDWPRPIWFPHTLVYATVPSGSGGPFEIFARAQSESYFNELRIALGIKSKSQLEVLVEEYRSNKRQVPSWGGFDRIDPSALMNIDRLATKP